MKKSPFLISQFLSQEKITGEKYNAVLISQEDWLAIQETLYLVSIQGMRESIKEGLSTSVTECYEELDW